MVEPTETESKEEMDNLVNAFLIISDEAYSHPKIVKEAPITASIDRVDEVEASHPKTLCLSWRMMKKDNK